MERLVSSASGGGGWFVRRQFVCVCGVAAAGVCVCVYVRCQFVCVYGVAAADSLKAPSKSPEAVS